jgi:putative addiction module component (TIGR02574 family)
MMSPIEVPPEILSLFVDHRPLLVEKIWDSIHKDGLPPISQASRDFIDRRIDEADANPESRVAAALVFEELGRQVSAVQFWFPGEERVSRSLRQLKFGDGSILNPHELNGSLRVIVNGQ